MLILATQNKHKISEIALALGDVRWREIDSSWRVAEGTESLTVNAVVKVRSARPFAAGDEVILGEDTGLFVYSLRGEPGVLSARYAGEGCAFSQNIEKLLNKLKDKDEAGRRASFLTAAALSWPNGRLLVACGRLDGEIAREPKGSFGFGYDPVFYCPLLGKTLAEISPEEKNAVSHRARAVRTLLPYLEPSRHVVSC